MNVVVTGASGGIGSAIARRFLDGGHSVAGIDRQAATAGHARYTHFQADIRDEAALPALENVDILINCAGTQNEDDIDTNLKALIRVTEKYGVRKGIRSILHIGSASGHTGSEFPEYSASKGGVVAYTKNVALRVAKWGATCNSLDPGGVLTPLYVYLLRSALGADHGGNAPQALGDAGGDRRLGVFPHRGKPLLHRAEHRGGRRGIHPPPLHLEGLNAPPPAAGWLRGCFLPRRGVFPCPCRRQHV